MAGSLRWVLQRRMVGMRGEAAASARPGLEGAQLSKGLSKHGILSPDRCDCCCCGWVGVPGMHMLAVWCSTQLLARSGCPAASCCASSARDGTLLPLLWDLCRQRSAQPTRPTPPVRQSTRA